MRPARPALFAALVVTALLVQVSVLDRIRFPVTPPDLLLVVVIAVAFVSGVEGGLITGFAAGLLADLVPPADHPVGLLALVFAVVGYAAGHLEDVEERSVLAPVLVVAAGTVGAALVSAVVAGLIGELGRSWFAVTRGAVVCALYDVVLTPFVVPGVAKLAHRFEPATSRR